MATESDVLEKLKKEFDTWRNGKPTPYNTGYDGQGIRSTETTKMSELEGAASSFKSYVTSALGHLYSVRIAKSFSGSEENEWSVLVEKAGESRPSLNFHMRISS